MGRKDILKYSILTAKDASASFDTKATPTNVDYLDNCGIQVTWTGSPVGTLEVLVSDDSTNPTVWSSLDFGAVIAIDATNSDLLINLNQIPFSWIALKYTKTSGTGTISAKLTAKQVGG